MKRLFLLLLLSIVVLAGCQQIVEDVIDITIDEVIKYFEDDGRSKTKSQLTEREAKFLAKDLTELEVHYIDVGQSDATLLRFTDDKKIYHILYDAGDWNRSDLINYLKTYDITHIDLVIASHPHADHIGQLAQVMEHFTVDEVWASGNTSTSGTFVEAMEAISASDANYHEPRAGETYSIGPLTIDVIHPETLTGGLNEDSLSVRFSYGSISFLFTGDAYQSQEKQMIKRIGNLQSTILRLGHHGSNTSSSKEFIQAVQPEIAVYSAGENNTYGHPSKETVDLIKKEKIPLYGTDKDGTIVVTTDGKAYEIATKKDGTYSPENISE